MKIKWTLYLILFLYLETLSGQKISGVKFWLDDNRISVKYDLGDESPGNQYFIGLKFISDKGNEIIPESTKGDIGKNVKPGMGKVITWDIVKDKFEFSGNLKAIVTATPLYMHLGGPSNALLSLVVPGLGGYFVEENKWRPLATTLVTAGLISYGIYQKTEENKYYSDYNSSTDADDILMLYDKANSAHHKYYISIMTGSVIWIADIIWVYYKGRGNLEKQKSYKQSLQGSGFKLNYNMNELQIGYVLNF